MKSLATRLRAAFQALRFSETSMQYLVNRVFLKFLLWQMVTEHRIGWSTGMNPQYLAQLRIDITNMEGDLLKLELLK